MEDSGGDVFGVVEERCGAENGSDEGDKGQADEQGKARYEEVQQAQSHHHQNSHVAIEVRIGGRRPCEGLEKKERTWMDLQTVLIESIRKKETSQFINCILWVRHLLTE